MAEQPVAEVFSGTTSNNRIAFVALFLASAMFIVMHSVEKLLHENNFSRMTCGYNPNVNKECMCGGSHKNYEGAMPDDFFSPFLHPLRALFLEGTGYLFWVLLVFMRHTALGRVGTIEGIIFEGSIIRAFSAMCLAWSLGVGIPEIVLKSPVAGLFSMPLFYFIIRRQLKLWRGESASVTSGEVNSLVVAKRLLTRVFAVFVFVGVAPVLLLGPLVNSVGVDVFTVLVSLVTLALELLLSVVFFPDKAVEGVGDASLVIVARAGLTFVESYRLATLSVSAATSDTLVPVLISIGLGVVMTVCARESLFKIAVRALYKPRHLWRPNVSRHERLLLGAKLDTEYVPIVVCGAIALLGYANDAGRDCAGNVVPGLRPPLEAMVIILIGEMISGVTAHYFGVWFNKIAPDIAVPITVVHPSSKRSVLMLQYLACFGVSTLAYSTMGGVAYDVAYKEEQRRFGD